MAAALVAAAVDDTAAEIAADAAASFAQRRRRRGEEEGPLGVPKILLRVIELSKPSLEELRNFRLVGRLWNDVTLELWRARATLKLIPDIPEPPETCTSSTLSSPIYLRNDTTGVPMSEFLSNIVDPSDPYDLDATPYSRVKLKGIDIEDEMEFTGADCEIINVFPRIWDLIGPFVTYLHIEECTFENTLKMGAFQMLILERTPFLHTLCMTNNIVIPPSWEQNPRLIIRYDYSVHLTTLHIHGGFPMGLVHFLHYIPRIEELHVRNARTDLTEDRHDFQETWVPISNLRRDNRETFNIKRLDVMHSDVFKISFNPTNQFRCTALPLQLLSVEVEPFIDSNGSPPQQPAPSTSRSGADIRIRTAEDILAPMLREHRGSLETFKLFRPPFSEPFTHFPFSIRSELMKELHLWGNITDSMNFLKYMPNLRVLFVNTTCYEKWDEMASFLDRPLLYEYQPFRDDIVKYTACFQSHLALHMESMRELHIELALQPESICTLAEWMPNLRVFNCILDKITFRGVCAFMPRLEHLTCLFGSDVDTDTVTGVSPGTPRDPANITGLKWLRTLTLNAYCGKAQLKDSAVYLGFMRMRRLRKLVVCVSKQMSERAEEEVRTVVPEVRFIRNYGPGPHLNYECCRRVTFVRDVMRRYPNLQSTFDRVFSV